MVAYAHISNRSAYLWTDFGLSLAKRYFDEATLAALPRFVRGKNKGQIKAQIEWRRVDNGGWVGQGSYMGDTPRGYVERRVGKIISANLKTAEWGKEGAIIATWTRPAEQHTA